MQTCELKNLINELKNHVFDVGEEILKIYKNDTLQISYKNDNSPLTIADEIANKMIVTKLQEICPHIPLVSEEKKNKEANEIGDTFFLIDPIDGTKEFINKSDEFTINIALIKNKKTIAGIVYCPALKEMYHCYNNQSFCNDKQIKVKEYNPNSVKVACSKSHSSKEEIENFLKQNNINNYEIVRLGSSLKICRIAKGEVDLYPRLGNTMEWDTAAAHAVLKQAGGFLTTLDGKELTYAKNCYKNPYFVASNIKLI